MTMITRVRVAAAVAVVASLALMGGCSSKKDPEPGASSPTTQEQTTPTETPTDPVPSDQPTESPLPTDGGDTPFEPIPVTVQIKAGDKIGVAMPWKGTQNFAEAVDRFPAALEAAGYVPVVQDANNELPKQQSQIESMVQQGVKAIVVGAVDGQALGSVLEAAKAAGVLIIGYDRLIQNTNAVDAVVQYGAIQSGVKEAEALLQGLQEKKPGGPWVIEEFAGSPTDPNAKFFWDGAQTVLKEYFDSGQITVLSGQTQFLQAATREWDNATAQTRMDFLIATYYANGTGPDGVLTPYDGIARAVLTACENAGLTAPIVDGLDAEDESVKWIDQGKQYATVAKPTDPMIEKTIELINSVANESTLPAPTNTTFNEVIDLPLYELEPTIVTKANVEELFAEVLKK